MIVCVCASISDRAVRAARDASARTVEAVAAATGAGADCGCCAGTIERILAEPPEPHGSEPCRGEPCEGCPRRAGPTEAVPRRAAAGGVSAP